MATDHELINTYVIQYQEALQDIKIFGLQYPDNKDGYNALIDIAKRTYERALAVGMDTLAPLPPKK
ncbi:MAG: hypothetical protein LBM41_01750 [Ruminococcus sp.]|jgi:hypothetical protein|nr:hypothetical protein [Ruminococcus sp.]